MEALTDFEKAFAVACGSRSPEETELLGHLLRSARLGHLCLPDSPKVEGLAGFVWEEGYLYLKRFWDLEQRIVKEVRRLQEEPLRLKLPGLNDNCQGLSSEQRQAIQKVEEGCLTLLCGGPGTGKSFTLSRLISSFREIAPEAKVAVAAPTGKAASNLGVQSTTLHALLGLREGREPPFPTPLVADLIVVDEASMIDVTVMAQLLSSVRRGGRLVLVGDPNQLPPVEAGGVFADLCKALPERVATLTRCLRTEREELIRIASEINQGSITGLEALPLAAFDPQEALKNNRMVLTAMNYGQYGVERLNAQLMMLHRARLAPDVALKLPIMIKRTDHELRLYNGELGLLIQNGPTPSPSDRAVFGERSLPVSLLPPYQPAFALSIHKSQGSEYERVAILLPTGSEAFGRQLLYTGLTRARKEATLYADPATLQAVLSKFEKRNSRIIKLLRSH